MKLKVELVALAIGLIGAGFSLCLVTWWSSFPAGFREFFRGGNPGAQIQGLCILIGLFGLVVLCANLFQGRRQFWWLRTAGFMCFVFLLALFGAQV